MPRSLNVPTHRLRYQHSQVLLQRIGVPTLRKVHRKPFGTLADQYASARDAMNQALASRHDLAGIFLRRSHSFARSLTTWFLVSFAPQKVRDRLDTSWNLVLGITTVIRTRLEATAVAIFFDGFEMTNLMPTFPLPAPAAPKLNLDYSALLSLPLASVPDPLSTEPPAKRISSEDDVTTWLSSEAFARFMRFVVKANEAIKGMKVSQKPQASPVREAR